MRIEEKIKTERETDFSLFFCILVNQFTSGQMLEKANLLFLAKEATDKDLSSKTQLLMATDSQKMKI